MLLVDGSHIGIVVEIVTYAGLYIDAYLVAELHLRSDGGIQRCLDVLYIDIFALFRLHFAVYHIFHIGIAAYALLYHCAGRAINLESSVLPHCHHSVNR